MNKISTTFMGLFGRLKALAAGVAFVLVAAVATAVAPTAAWAGPAPALPPVEGEVIVGFKAQSPTLRKHALAAQATSSDIKNALAQRASALGSRTKRLLQAGEAVGPNTQVVRVPGMDARALARELAADPEVAYAVPNGRRRATAVPNDPLYAALPPGQRASGPDSGQWYLRAPSAAEPSAINIEAAWAKTMGKPTVVVAVLDTGVRFDHPDLGRAAAGGQLLPGHDFVSDSVVANDGSGRDADPSDPGDWITSADARSVKFEGCQAGPSSWHGTATASLVAAAANNGQGMTGVAPGVKVLPVRVLGKCFGTDADIQAGMLWAAGIAVDGVPANPNPAQVINLSLGGDGLCDAAYQSVIAQILARGVTIVAAAGNTAGGLVNVPANCPGVIGVTGLRHAGTKVGFSDLGPEVSIAAPAGNCINTAVGTPCLYPILAATDRGAQGPVGGAWTNSFDVTVGTSFSSPLVAGVAGLMLSLQPGLTPTKIKQVLQQTARPFPTTGGENGPDEPPVARCVAPAAGVEQFQCYCTTGLCGAGMLDAGAALVAVGGVVATVAVVTAPPRAQTAVALSAAASRSANGSTVTGYLWRLVDGGGIVTQFDGANNVSSVSLTPIAAGTFTVSVTATDSAGSADTVQTTVTVEAAPAAPAAAPGSGSGAGGGASSCWAVLALALAAALLHRANRQPR